MVNWKAELSEWKKLPLKKIKIGMLAKLIVGKEKGWNSTAWVNFNKGNVYKVVETNGWGYSVGVGVPRSDLPESSEITFQDIHTCYGEAKWFLYKEA